jgi:hypothetical protein
MTTIRVECAACATTADLPAGALLLALAAPRDPATFVGRVETVASAADYIGYPDDSEGGAAIVMWLCHGCGQLVGMHLSANWVSALRDLGVQLVDADYRDPRPEHPEQPIGGAPFTPDDLLTLHEQLATDAWFAALTAGCGQP